jgi:hypothetical protein
MITMPWLWVEQFVLVLATAPLTDTVDGRCDPWMRLRYVVLSGSAAGRSATMSVQSGYAPQGMRIIGRLEES